MNTFPFSRTKARTAASIILRGPNDFYCDEMERSVHDALCVVKRVLESKTLVVGGGAVEVALSIYLESFATSLVTSAQKLFFLLSSLFMFVVLPFYRAHGSSWPLRNLPALCWSSLKRWPLTLQRMRRTSWPSCDHTTTRPSPNPSTST